VTDTLERVDPGARSQRRRRRALRRRLAVWGAAFIALVILAGVVVSRLGGSSPPAAEPVGGAAEGEQITYLLIGDRTDDLSGQAAWLTLLAVDRAGRRPITLFVPTNALTEIPGFGFDAVGKAFALGRAPLQAVTVANVLGVRIDHTLVVPDEVMAAIVDGAGGIEVTIAERLLAPDGPDRLVPKFEAGRQRLDGVRAVEYLAYRGPSEDELARFVRAQQVWEAIYTRFAGERAGELARIVSSMGAKLVTDAAPADVGAFLAAFATAARTARAYRTLPVEAVGSAGPEDAYRIQTPQVQDLVGRFLAPSKPPAGAGVGASVQILNGNGSPEAGLAVAQVLVPAGFRIADTGNASSFDFRTTRIIVYREADLPVAQRIRELLGLGAVEIGLTAQTIVDVTVVVGEDFVPRTG
jgi:polyisoprenyl-teichoic acid--peptidoglycan teichoic acid transferase